MAFSSTRQDEIQQLGQSIRQMEHELAVLNSQQQRQKGFPKFKLDSDAASSDPPVLYPHSETPVATRTKSKPKKEIEARRYAGKEPINEYLLQFELTSRRNEWTDAEKATSLLCALDGQARNILSELDDVNNTPYSEIKQLLLSRFGPIRLTEVHEQALHDVKLARGQPIREISSEIVRLTKLAYPEFQQSARTRIAVSALISAIGDKDAVYYIKDKNPATIDDVCTFFERFRVLTGNNVSGRSVNVKCVKPDDFHSVLTPPETSELLPALLKQAEITNGQIQQLTQTVSTLFGQMNNLPPYPPLNLTLPPQTNPTPPIQQSSMNPTVPPFTPRTPCPQCRQYGHWKRDCPTLRQPENHSGPGSAPTSRPSQHQNTIRCTQPLI